MIGQEEIFIRLLLSTLLGAVIGVEREFQKRPAGLRTHVLVSVVSCLIMIVGIGMAGTDGKHDPVRMAAQVVSGMGFLGAGTIMRTGNTIKGLTTAATLWASAGIGLAIGGGFYFASILAVVIIVTTLFVLSRIEAYITGLLKDTLSISLTGDIGRVKHITGTLEQCGAIIRNLHMEDISEHNGDENLLITYGLRRTEAFNTDHFLTCLKDYSGIHEIRFHNKTIYEAHDDRPPNSDTKKEA